mmetsp:Transcript_1925/g.2956  ORF Transcript_1925/g.2956 Transcript_1925/m.2956 type:complete len:258 (+) Transcript_1925:104-877(+)
MIFPDTTFAATITLLIGSGLVLYRSSSVIDDEDKGQIEDDFSVLPCIRSRCSIFPSAYLQDPPPLDERIIQSLLDAALWGPYHGKCFSGCQHPAKFVVLGKQSMVEMQNMTLDYYDKNWKEVGWGSGNDGSSREEYEIWRKMTQDEITGRWGPCCYMIAIIMRRQTGPKRLPEWEEGAAVAAATQNMHIQSTKFPQLACYWSSWHDAARDSDEMKNFLKMDDEDKCLGFFIVAQRKDPRSKDRRKRDKLVMGVEWRP